MEPKSPEQAPSSVEMPSMPDVHEGLSIRSPEYSQEQAVEKRPTQTDDAMRPVAPVVQLPTPVTVPGPSNDSQATTNSAAINPVAAADEDLIEKEWVDKAKKVVSETKDDPHKQERAVGKLQADYLKKRYGKELGSSM